jgi:hypothetical protein
MQPDDLDDVKQAVRDLTDIVEAQVKKRQEHRRTTRFDANILFRLEVIRARLGPPSTEERAACR